MNRQHRLPLRSRRAAEDGLALLALGLLAACGNPDATPPAPTVAAAAPTAAATVGADVPSAEQLFQWAQLTYPELFPDAPPLRAVHHEGRDFVVRSYTNGEHLGVSAGEVFGLGSFTQGRLQSFGSLAGWSDTVCSKVGCGAWDAERGQVYAAVTVNPPAASGLVQTVPRGTAIDVPQIAGTIGGDVAGLAGRPLGVVVEDPSALFEAGAQVRLQSGSPWRYTLELRPRALPRAGRFTGTLRVFACLDSGCTTRLDGTPLRLPYDVTVIQGLRAEPAALTFRSSTGAPPAAQTVALSFDPSLSGATVTSVSGGRLTQEGQPTDAVFALADLAGTQLQVRLPGARAGTWQGALSLEVAYRLPGSPGAQRTERLDLPITYAVAGSNALAVAQPDRLDFRLRSGVEESSVSTVEFLMETGHLQFLGIDYLSHPAAETDASLRSGWLEATEPSVRTYFHVRPTPCRADGGTRRCLQPGLYTAQARHRVQVQELRDGQLVVAREEELRLPITLTVLPP